MTVLLKGNQGHRATAIAKAKKKKLLYLIKEIQTNDSRLTSKCERAKRKIVESKSRAQQNRPVPICKCYILQEHLLKNS